MGQTFTTMQFLSKNTNMTKNVLCALTLNIQSIIRHQSPKFALPLSATQSPRLDHNALFHMARMHSTTNSINHNHHIKCWSCGAVLPPSPILCQPGCNAIQPPSATVSTQNYFELLSQPTSYTISIKKIHQRYLKLQQKVHPDNFSGRDEKERMYSDQVSSRINKAYEVLKDPLHRAIYMVRDLAW